MFIPSSIFHMSRGVTLPYRSGEVKDILGFLTSQYDIDKEQGVIQLLCGMGIYDVKISHFEIGEKKPGDKSCGYQLVVKYNADGMNQESHFYLWQGVHRKRWSIRETFHKTEPETHQ